MNRPTLVAALLILPVFAAQGQGESELSRLATWLEGTFDNRAQVEAERSNPGMAPDDRHVLIRIHQRRVALPAFGSHVFYAQEYRDDDPTQVIKQRLITLQVDETEQNIRMTQHFFKNADSVRGAHKDPAKLSQLTADDIWHLPGCDVFWRWEDDRFTAAMGERTCAFSFGEDDPQRYVDYHLTLTDSEYTRIDHSFYVATGQPAGGRVDSDPAVYNRIGTS